MYSDEALLTPPDCVNHPVPPLPIHSTPPYKLPTEVRLYVPLAMSRLAVVYVPADCVKTPTPWLLAVAFPRHSCVEAPTPPDCRKVPVPALPTYCDEQANNPPLRP